MMECLQVQLCSTKDSADQLGLRCQHTLGTEGDVWQEAAV